MTGFGLKAPLVKIPLGPPISPKPPNPSNESTAAAPYRRVCAD